VECANLGLRRGIRYNAPVRTAGISAKKFRFSNRNPAKYAGTSVLGVTTKGDSNSSEGEFEVKEHAVTLRVAFGEWLLPFSGK
jgi:hypothetical protein